MLKPILKEIINAKVAKKNCQLKYQQAKASVAYATTTPVTKGVTAVNSHTPAITTGTVSTVLRDLRQSL